MPQQVQSLADAPRADIVPIFVVRREADGETLTPIEFCGTGFVVGPGLLITCWHCVSGTLEEDMRYAVFFGEEDDQRTFTGAVLSNVSQDDNGSDLATASLPLVPPMTLSLRIGNVDRGQEVAALGFPLTSPERTSEGTMVFSVADRYLAGYVTRVFMHDRYGLRPTYELDMPTPAGLSGAPVFIRGTAILIGVVFGENEVGSIEQFARIDPETGEREPEIQRVVSFGLAHSTETLSALSGTATGGKSLAEFLGGGKG